MSGKKEPITPEMAEKVLEADWKNLVKKVAGGKILTSAERDRLLAKAAGCDDSVLTVKTYQQLAELIGVNVRTVNRWRKKAGAPEPLPGGQINIIAWREFVRAHNLKSGETDNLDIEALKARKLLAEVEDREIRTAVLKGEYVPLEQVRQEWTSHVGKARALLEARLLNECPPILSGMDAVSIREELQKVLDEVYTTLHSGETCTP